MRQLEYRLHFTMRRFGNHAPYYQFVIWARLFLLTLCSIMPDAIVDPRRETLLDPYLNDKVRTVVIASAGCALGTLLIAWVYHRVTHPHAYQFQNKLESWLIGSAMLSLTVCSIYTFADSDSAFLDFLMMFIMVGSIVGAILQNVLGIVGPIIQKRLREYASDLVASLPQPKPKRHGPFGTPPGSG